MKTLCNIVAVLSLMLFIGLIGNAMTAMFASYVSIPLALPPDVHTVYHGTRQLDCMAQNIYWEAQGEPAKGKALVGMVVLERTYSPHFPNTICGVVFQAQHDSHGRIILHRCQFSWVCDGKNHAIKFKNSIDEREWLASYAIAKLVMAGKAKIKIDMSGVTHYHANYVRPFWARSKNYKLVTRVGDHLFYRWKKANIPPNNLAMR